MNDTPSAAPRAEPTSGAAAGPPTRGKSLQWGGRFTTEPDTTLIAFGSSLEEDLVLAPFDVRCSRAHVVALRKGGIISDADASALDAALAAVAEEIASCTFTAFARAGDFEDVHGAIDRRVREIVASAAGERLHAGRSRNDQVATTLQLYARDRATRGRDLSLEIARRAIAEAREALVAGTCIAATTHWQPAQPVLLAFRHAAVAEMFARAARRFERVRIDACELAPLGSGACSGSTLPLDRAASAAALGFAAPSRNAMDAIGNRDVATDLAYAVASALGAASRVSEEIVLYCTPAFGYAQLDDAASTGSSLMPQKRNPDPFELVRAHAASAAGALGGVLGTQTGIALSYHRDLQETKRLAIGGIERGIGALAAFSRALGYVRWNAPACDARAAEGYAVATDLADALILRGVTARRAHELVGTAVSRAEAACRPLDASDLTAIAHDAGLDALDAPLDARASVAAKRTIGSTSPQAVAAAIDALTLSLDAYTSDEALA